LASVKSPLESIVPPGCGSIRTPFETRAMPYFRCQCYRELYLFSFSETSLFYWPADMGVDCFVNLLHQWDHHFISGSTKGNGSLGPSLRDTSGYST